MSLSLMSASQVLTIFLMDEIKVSIFIAAILHTVLKYYTNI